MAAKSQNKEQLDNLITDQFDDVLKTLSSFRSQVTSLQQQIRTIEKSVKKKIKDLQKEASKHKYKGNRKPSGFAKPTKISDKLCAFMGKESGAEVARTEVTQYIISYINTKELQDPNNRKKIKPNDALQDLLGVDDDAEITYFNIQKFMNQHFQKMSENTQPTKNSSLENVNSA